MVSITDVRSEAVFISKKSASFIGAATGQKINVIAANQANITVVQYEAKHTAPPTSKIFNTFLRQFEEFCQSNAGTTCEMLLLTGLHGEYNPPMLNNLTKSQLEQLVSTSKNYQVTFKWILSDSCCALLGLKVLSDMLAPEGFAVGDRMTSTEYKFQDKLNEMLEQKEYIAYDKLVSSVISQLNSPAFITKQGKHLQAFGMTREATIPHLISLYTAAGMLDPQVSEETRLNNLKKIIPEDLNHLAADLKNANQIVPTTELADINQLVEKFQTLTKDKQVDGSQAFEKDIQKFQILKAQFHYQKDSDLLKNILLDFKEVIEETPSLEDLEELKEVLLSSVEYEILEIGERLLTKTLDVEKSLIKAVYEMLKEQEQLLRTKQNNRFQQ